MSPPHSFLCTVAPHTVTDCPVELCHSSRQMTYCHFLALTYSHLILNRSNVLQNNIFPGNTFIKKKITDFFFPQNPKTDKGWKGPLGVIWSSLLLRWCHPRAHSTGLYPDNSLISPVRERPQALWTIYPSVWSPAQ